MVQPYTFFQFEYDYPPYIKNTFPQPYKDQNIGDKCFLTDYAYYAQYKYTYEPCKPGALYRTYDGSCNNLKFPWWGMTFSPLVRLFPAKYADNKKLPRLSSTGLPLPNARLLRTKIIESKKNMDDIRYWTLLISWSQFVSHDTGHSLPKKEKLDCCAQDYVSDLDTCLPIPILKDHFYNNHSVTCINMVRGMTTDDLGCPLSPIQHVIDLTHFLDVSPVYGSTRKIAEKLRLFKGGLLKGQHVGGKEYPPNYGRPKSKCDIQPDEPAVCYFAGDSRANQNSFLTPLQVLFLRLHNILAREFAKINHHWDDERLYQEARKTVIGIYQWITYEEMLPVLIGKDVVAEHELKTNAKTDAYKDYVNPGTLNEFQTAAYRTLHGIIPKVVWMIAKSGKAAQIDMVTWMHRPSIVQGYLDHLLEGQQTQFIQPFEDWWEDFNINNKLKTNHPPFQYDPHGDDLTAIGIQRQRDYGMPGYNEFRKYAGLKPVKSFEELSDVIGPENIHLLKLGYKHVDDIDLFVGGYLENPLHDSLFGPTFTYVIADQFYRWKFGDRFWFSVLGKPWSFTEEQYHEILKTTTGWLFCEAGDNFEWVHKNNINNKILGNQLLTPCHMLPKFDYSKWADPKGPYYDKAPKVGPPLFG
ncbi:peroxidase-like [Diaphorina citri]|uniref:Peroxidase-like n=1 Tax=Diaphorina citri TaxID=121845 RepID=A0A1S3D3U1_DIACI|nr:peroxidase-like [Diaphorina citri]